MNLDEHRALGAKIVARNKRRKRPAAGWALVAEVLDAIAAAEKESP